MVKIQESEVGDEPGESRWTQHNLLVSRNGGCPAAVRGRHDRGFEDGAMSQGKWGSSRSRHGNGTDSALGPPGRNAAN